MSKFFGPKNIFQFTLVIRLLERQMYFYSYFICGLILKYLTFNYFVKIYNQKYSKKNVFSAIDQNLKKNSLG